MRYVLVYIVYRYKDTTDYFKVARKIKRLIFYCMYNVNLPIPEFAPVIITTFSLKSRP